MVMTLFANHEYMHVWFTWALLELSLDWWVWVIWAAKELPAFAANARAIPIYLLANSFASIQKKCGATATTGTPLCSFGSVQAQNRCINVL